MARSSGRRGRRGRLLPRFGGSSGSKGKRRPAPAPAPVATRVPAPTGDTSPWLPVHPSALEPPETENPWLPEGVHTAAANGKTSNGAAVPQDAQAPDDPEPSIEWESPVPAAASPPASAHAWQLGTAAEPAPPASATAPTRWLPTASTAEDTAVVAAVAQPPETAGAEIPPAADAPADAPVRAKPEGGSDRRAALLVLSGLVVVIAVAVLGVAGAFNSGGTTKPGTPVAAPAPAPRARSAAPVHHARHARRAKPRAAARRVTSPRVTTPRRAATAPVRTTPVRVAPVVSAPAPVVRPVATPAPPQRQTSTPSFPVSKVKPSAPSGAPGRSG